jgi:hypothetical protein
MASDLEIFVKAHAWDGVNIIPQPDKLCVRVSSDDGESLLQEFPDEAAVLAMYERLKAIATGKVEQPCHVKKSPFL